MSWICTWHVDHDDSGSFAPPQSIARNGRRKRQPYCKIVITPQHCTSNSEYGETLPYALALELSSSAGNVNYIIYTCSVRPGIITCIIVESLLPNSQSDSVLVFSPCRYCQLAVTVQPAQSYRIALPLHRQTGARNYRARDT